MNLFAPQHFIPILVILLLLFGRGKISDLMGDFATGIRNFKKGLKDDDVLADEKREINRGIAGTYNQDGHHSVSGRAVSETSGHRSSEGQS